MDKERESTTADTPARDSILIEDESGTTRQFEVEALFDMDEQSYALLRSEQEMVLMRVVDGDDDEQYLEGINDPEEASAILDAYQVAVDAAPAE